MWADAETSKVREDKPPIFLLLRKSNWLSKRGPSTDKGSHLLTLPYP